MNKRLERIKQIDQAVADITASLNKLQKLTKTTEDIAIKEALSDYIVLLSYINYRFMMYIISVTPKSVKRGYLDQEFKRMMKDFFKNGK